MKLPLWFWVFTLLLDVACVVLVYEALVHAAEMTMVSWACVAFAVFVCARSTTKAVFDDGD